MFTRGITRSSLSLSSVPICKDKHDYVDSTHCLSTVSDALFLSELLVVRAA